MRMLRKTALICVAIFTIACMVHAQESESPGPAVDVIPGVSESVFARWLTVSAGALPFAVFYTNMAFGVGSFVASGFDPAYAPPPFGGLQAQGISTEERMLRLGISFGISVVIGLVDSILLHLK